VPSPTAANPAATAAGFCNLGKGRYTGIEGEGAYAFDFGLTLFANGSLNSAKQLATPANAAAGIAAAPAQTVTNAPKWTYAAGGIYHAGPWAASLTYKNSGAYVAGYDGAGHALHLPGYDSVDASVSYDFGRRISLQLQALNLADKRAITSFSGAALYSLSDTGLYQYQAGRMVEGTITARF
jgi:iron complex outermembrane receptor protein